MSSSPIPNSGDPRVDAGLGGVRLKFIDLEDALLVQARLEKGLADDVDEFKKRLLDDVEELRSVMALQNQTLKSHNELLAFHEDMVRPRRYGPVPRRNGMGPRRNAPNPRRYASLPGSGEQISRSFPSRARGMDEAHARQAGRAHRHHDAPRRWLGSSAIEQAPSKGAGSVSEIPANDSLFALKPSRQVEFGNSAD